MKKSCVGIFLVCIVVCIALGVTVFTAHTSTPSLTHEYERELLTIGNAVVTADIADTPEKRVLGLSGRSTLLPDTGMLFIFDTPGPHDMWMKDMHFSIDILWLDEAYEIIHIERRVSPDTYPTSFGSPIPASYVLEVPAGFTSTYHVKVGDTIGT